MILKKSLKMVPIILGIAVNGYSVGTDLTFNEKDILEAPQKNTFNILEYKNQLTLFGFDSIYMSNRIRNYVKDWKEETMILSDIHEILNNNNFKQIVALGKEAIPYILNEIKEQPSKLVWSLNLILGKKISNKSVTIKEACTAWVKWGIENKYI